MFGELIYSLDKYVLKTEFKFANQRWGVRNISTGIWPPGTVAMVCTKGTVNVF